MNPTTHLFGKRKKRKADLPPAAAPSYIEDTHRPLHCLVFLLPLVVLYEIGTAWLHPDPAAADQSRVIAFLLFQRFLEVLGAGSVLLPGIAVVVILLVWHIATGEPWRVRVRTVLWMAAESVALGVPMIVLSSIVSSKAAPVLMTLSPQHAYMMDRLLLSVGAGIYEELIFRLMLISLLHLVMVDIAKVREQKAAVIIVMVAAVVFSLYHYLGPETFAWSSFAFRTIAGLYLGAIFVVRGFGIAVGAHAAYDIMVIISNS